MFKNCTSLIQAPELPATTLANDCYGFMFQNCTSLNQAPELPATTLANDCYNYMFWYCTSLTQAPELPATTLSRGCYDYMFSGCTSLVQAPELPATQLTEYCYRDMFSGCTSLVQAPELPATTLEIACYHTMFSGCNKLNYIKCLATDISAEFCTDDWLSNVASVGTFECDNKKYFTLDSPNGIPVGWTITEINPDPDPEAFDPTTPFYIENIGDVPVEVGLYNHSPNTQVRRNCKISHDLKTWQNYSLALAINPTDSLIGKITLTNKGDRVYIKADLNTKPSTSHYTHLTVLNSSTDTKIKAHGNIASLNKGTDDAYKTNYLTADDHGYLYLFLDCTSLIQAPELPATTLASDCYRSMFYGCTSLIQAPELPATTLADYCYDSMFQHCTSLTQAPNLPATTLAQSCYIMMFYDCTSLNYIKCLATDISAANCTNGWVIGISSTTGDFYTPASTVWTSGANGIPTGWTRHDA